MRSSNVCDENVQIDVHNYLLLLKECKGMKVSLLPKADVWAVPPETKLVENPVALEHT